MSNKLHTDIPDQRGQQVLANNLREVFTEALCHYIKSQQAILTETFIQYDVQWGLYGKA